MANIDDETVNKIVASIPSKFRTFGGGEVRTKNNPVALALKNEPLQFAAGVDVTEVVRHILAVA